MDVVSVVDVVTVVDVVSGVVTTPLSTLLLPILNLLKIPLFN